MGGRSGGLGSLRFLLNIRVMTPRTHNLILLEPTQIECNQDLDLLPNANEQKELIITSFIVMTSSAYETVTFR